MFEPEIINLIRSKLFRSKTAINHREPRTGYVRQTLCDNNYTHKGFWSYHWESMLRSPAIPFHHDMSPIHPRNFEASRHDLSHLQYSVYFDRYEAVYRHRSKWHASTALMPLRHRSIDRSIVQRNAMGADGGYCELQDHFVVSPRRRCSPAAEARMLHVWCASLVPSLRRSWVRAFLSISSRSCLSHFRLTVPSDRQVGD